MSRRVTTRALLSHHLRSRLGGAAVVALLVLVLSFLATAAPVVLGLLSDAALRDRLGVLGALERDVVSETAGAPQLGAHDLSVPSTTEEVWGTFLEAVERIRADADDPLPDILGEGRAVTTVTDMPVAEAPRTRAVSMAFAPGIEDEIVLVEGRMPEPAASYLDEPVASASIPGGSVANRVEVVVSADTAAQMEWAVGETRSVGTPAVLVELVLVGTFEPVDAEAGYWEHVPSSLTPKIFDDGNLPRVVTGMAFPHPASLISSGLYGLYSTTVWYPTDIDRISAATAEDTAAALRKLTAVSHTIGSSAGGIGILSLRFQADVTGEIELALAQGASTVAVIAMIVAGPIGVAAAVLVLGCRLILERRRPSLRLLSARGASLAQLRGILGLEGVVAGIVPAALGAAIAAIVGAAVFRATPTVLDFLPALVIGLAPIAILVVLAPAAAERRARTDLDLGGSRVRLIVEGIVLVLTALTLVLLFVRGYSSGLDPLLAAAPLLLAITACLITLRLYPIPLHGIFDRARRSSRLDAFVGSARALREPSIGLTPVLALVVGVSVAVSSGILLSALQAGITHSARAQVGADMRVTGGSFTLEQLDRVRDIDGVAAATGVSGADPSTLDVNGAKRATSVFVVDAAELRDVQGDGPGLLPPGVSLEPRDDGPMPMVVAGATDRIIGGSDELRLGSVHAEVVGVTSGPSPIGARENWAAIDESYAEDVLGRDPSDRTVLIRLEPDAAPEAVEEQLREAFAFEVRIDTADRIADRIQSGPAVQGVRWALLIATAVTALLSALAIVMTLTLATEQRNRLLALLRTLGAPRRAATSLALWEVGPPAVAAIVAGTVFGAIVPLVVLAAVDLRPFTGSTVQPSYQLDPAILALTVGGFVALAAVLTAVALLVSRRIRAARALRAVEEGT